MATTFADSVSITSRHTVHCANESSCTALDSPFCLGPLDHEVSPGIPVAVVFVYDKPPDFERLRRALARLLDYYPQLTGRLQVGSDQSVEITRLGTGAELLEAQCSERLDAFSSGGHVVLQNFPGAGNALMPPFDPAGISRDPVLTIQYTRFACGGVSLGVRTLHTLCDADGFFQMVQDLAELYRGLGNDADIPSLAHPPHIRPYLADLTATMSPEERAAALDFKPSLFYVEASAPAEAAPSSPPYAVNPLPPPPVVGRFLRFSSAELATLKENATDPTSSDSWVSTFDALSAHLHQRVYRARVRLRENDPSHGELSPPDFLTPVNIRSRIGTAQLPPRYFPNALLCTDASFPPDVLATAPLWQIAKVLHAMTRTSGATSKDELVATVRWLAAQPDRQRVKQSFRYGNGSLSLSQWNKVDMYAVFAAAPILVAPPFTLISLLDGL
ncbi:transferase family-domain-containing protein, partial [Mycena rosella]